MGSSFKIIQFFISWLQKFIEKYPVEVKHFGVSGLGEKNLESSLFKMFDDLTMRRHDGQAPDWLTEEMYEELKVLEKLLYDRLVGTETSRKSTTGLFFGDLKSKIERLFIDDSGKTFEAVGKNV